MTAQEQELRNKALLSLWKAAAAEVTIAHPDSRVDVKLAVMDWGTEQIAIRIAMDNLRDTADQDRYIEDFYTRAYAETWPGYEVARKYIAAIWALYLTHETLELVRHRQLVGCSRHDEHNTHCRSCNQEACIIDPHNEDELNQELLDADMPRVLAWALGDKVADRLVHNNRRVANKEFQNELEWLRDGWEPGT